MYTVTVVETNTRYMEDPIEYETVKTSDEAISLFNKFFRQYMLDSDPGCAIHVFQEEV